MSTRRLHMAVVQATLLAMPCTLLADFTLGAFPQFVQDQAPSWLFQILSAIFIGLFQSLTFGLFGLTTT